MKSLVFFFLFFGVAHAHETWDLHGVHVGHDDDISVIPTVVLEESSKVELAPAFEFVG